VANVASRLCAEAKSGQILITHRVLAAVEELIECEPFGEVVLKGLSRPVFRSRCSPIERLITQSPAELV
jgi:adenylate cyclase